MVEEIEKGPQMGSLLLYGVLTGVGILLSFSAFTRSVRKQILERDGYRCTVCGSTEHLEAAHINHQRGKNYNNPDMGITLCSSCHLDDHIQRAGMNGLTKSQNDWAIEMLSERAK